MSSNDITNVYIDRVDDDGEPDPNGTVEVYFLDSRGLIVVSVSMWPSGLVHAHALDTRGRVTTRATLQPGDTCDTE